MARSGTFAPAGGAPVGSARSASGGTPAGRMPIAGAVLVGTAVALLLGSVSAVVMGTLQRVGVVAVVPSWVYALGAYLSAVVGGWTAGRLAGRAGMLSGAVVGLLLLGVATWLGAPAQEAPAGLQMAVDWSAAWWRMALAVLAAGLAGGLAVSGS